MSLNVVIQVLASAERTQKSYRQYDERDPYNPENK